MKLFFYGTLKRGGALNGHLDEQKFLSQAIASGYILYNLGWYPGMKARSSNHVDGELWEIDERCLKDLDCVEGSSFKRSKIKLQSPLEKETVEAYLYLGDVAGHETCQHWSIS